MLGWKGSGPKRFCPCVPGCAISKAIRTTLTADARIKTIPKKKSIPAVANAPYKTKNRARAINRAGNKSHNPDLSRSCMRLMETVTKGMNTRSEPTPPASSPITGRTAQKDKTK